MNKQKIIKLVETKFEDIKKSLHYCGSGDYNCGLCEKRNGDCNIVYSYYDNNREPTKLDKEKAILKHLDNYHLVRGVN